MFDELVPNRIILASLKYKDLRQHTEFFSIDSNQFYFFRKMLI